MRVLVLTIYLFSLPFMAACAERNGEEIRVVTGKKFIYEIPRRYEKLPNSILYPSDFSGDDSKVISLLLTQREVMDSNLGDSWELSMLLFWDRDYRQGEEFHFLARGMLDGAAFQGTSDGLHQYGSSLGKYKKKYYLNFDPFGGKFLNSNGNYIVETMSSPAFEIAGIKKVPEVTCILHTTYDGIAVQLSAKGYLCSVNKFESLYAFIGRGMQEWAIGHKEWR